MAGAGVPLQARADPGGGVPDARRRRAPRRSREGRDLARGSLRGPRGGGGEPARASLARRRRRGQGGRLPNDGRRSRASGVRARRGDRAAIASCSRSSANAASRTRSRSSCSSSRSRSTCRCDSRRRTRCTSARSTSGAGRRDRPTSPPPPSVWGRASSRTTPILAPRSHGRTSSSVCSCSTASSRHGRSGRSCRRSRSGGRSPTTGSGTSSICARACSGRTVSRSLRTTSSSGSSGC